MFYLAVPRGPEKRDWLRGPGLAPLPVSLLASDGVTEYVGGGAAVSSPVSALFANRARCRGRRRSFIIRALNPGFVMGTVALTGKVPWLTAFETIFLLARVGLDCSTNR